MDYESLLLQERKYKRLNKAFYISIVIATVLFALGIFLFIRFFVKIMFIRDSVIVLLILVAIPILAIIIINALLQNATKNLKVSLEKCVLNSLNITDWMFTNICDDTVSVKSSQAVDKYDEIKYFKEDEGRLPVATSIIQQKLAYSYKLSNFLKDNEYKNISMYKTIVSKIEKNLLYTNEYRVLVSYISPAGRKQNEKYLTLTPNRINELNSDKSILMSKSEYNKYVKEQSKELLNQKQHDYYERVNSIIDNANCNKELLVIRSDADELDKLIASLFDRIVNSIKKIKSVDSEEWDVLNRFISGIEDDVKKITDKNNAILEYYNSEEFSKLKTTCDSLMSSQKEFNDYIDEKAKSISSLFGTNIVREETEIEDEYNYIHPYKKSLTPFTAEVSATVFSSAENNPLEYVVKQFYPNKLLYPEQIQRLQLLVEELETLKEAKTIIENQKNEIKQYLCEVPDFIMKNDEDGFYSRLGFATINEKTLVVDYKFSYTSAGGKSQRSFTVPMTEETIISLIQLLENKLTFSAFAKEQRSLMTSKLRLQIKERDNFTCQFCGNSIDKEPNLLLEIDHKIPVSMGGITEESNLQTLCWRCNRTKGSKIL